MKKLNSRAIGPEEKDFLESLRKGIFGQDAAIEAVAAAFGKHNSKLRDSNGPIGVFLFVGPPGTGKLATARAVAKHLFKDPSGFCYVNCSKPVSITQRDLDRAHQRFLEKIHKKEVDQINAWSKQIDKKMENLKVLWEEASKIKKELTELQKAIKRRGGKEAVIAASEQAKLKKLTSRHEELLSKATKDRNAYNKEVLEYNRQSIEMSRKGWQYDEKYPPKNLSSIVFYDQVEDDDSGFIPFLAEILDNGQVGVMRQGESVTLSFKNSLIFISLTISEEKLNKLLENEEHMGFKTMQGIVSNVAIDKKIKDSIAEETNIPIWILDRLEVIAFRKLSHENLKKILLLKLEEMRGDLVSKGIKLKIQIDDSLENRFIETAIKHSQSGAWFMEYEFKRNIEIGVMRLLRTRQIKSGDKILIKLEKLEGREEINFYKI